MSAPYSKVQSVQASGGAFNDAAGQTATAVWPSTTLSGNLLIAIGVTDGWDALGNPNPSGWATSAPAGWSGPKIHNQQGQTVAVWYILSSAPRSGSEVFNLGWDFIPASQFVIELMEIDAAGATFDTVDAMIEFHSGAAFSGSQALTGTGGKPSGITIGGAVKNGSSVDPAWAFDNTPGAGGDHQTKGSWKANEIAYINKGSSIRFSTLSNLDCAGTASDETIYCDTTGTNAQIVLVHIYPSAGDPSASNAYDQDIGHIASLKAIRGLAMEFDLLLTMGHIASTKAIRGLAMSSADTLTIGHIGSHAAVRGLAITGTHEIDIGHIDSLATVRGLELSGLVDLTIGHIASTKSIHGLVLEHFVPLTIGHIPSAKAVYGLAFSRITSPSLHFIVPLLDPHGQPELGLHSQTVPVFDESMRVEL